MSQPETHLDRIVARTRADLVPRMAGVDHAALERRAQEYTPRGFAAGLRAAARSRPAVIAELKRASPSKGLIRAEFEAGVLAAGLEQGGAAALSVLTDEPFFQGSLRNLEIARAHTALPCLRKDFIVDAFQILEARAHGADAVLLIAAALNDDELASLREAAGNYGLDVLCEVHSSEEIARVLPLRCEMYGVNSRDLRTFTVDPARAETMAAMLPAGSVRVAESGIRDAEDLLRMRRAGFDAFLIGESLMRAGDPGAALRELLGAAAWFPEAPQPGAAAKLEPALRD